MFLSARSPSFNISEAHILNNCEKRKLIFRIRRKFKIEGPSQSVCKFHQYGHCKFGTHCIHFHTKKTCSIPMCNQNQCTARHPKPCFYIFKNNYCKFGDSCSFLHPSPSPASCQLHYEILKVNDDLQLVITSLNIKEIEIQKLEGRI